MLKLLKEKLKSWKSQEMKLGPLNRLCGPFAVFRPGVSKDMAVHF